MEDLCRKCGENPRTEKRRICVLCIKANQKEADAKWYKANRKKIKEARKDKPYNSAEAKRARYLKNKDKITIYDAWRKINYRAKKFGHEAVALSDISRLVSERNTCEDCGTTEKLTIGHRIPLVNLMATNLFGNLIRQCKSCNSKQSQRIHHTIATDEMRKHFRIYYPNN